MDEQAVLAEQFEAHRARLRAVAYRMLGSLSEADDAVQEAWLRLSRSDMSAIENLSGWLTVVVARVCLDMLRSRKARREESLDTQVPHRVVNQQDKINPEQELLLADSVGIALLVVLNTLTPPERLAFVLHDLFAIPFEEIASILGRSTIATRQLASRARRRVRGVPTVPHRELARQHDVVGAFLAASRSGDFEALLTVLDSEVVVRVDRTAALQDTPREVRGPRAVAEQALIFSRRARFAQLALVNGTVGIVVAPRGHLFAIMIFAVSGNKIFEIDILSDPQYLGQVKLAVLDH